MTKIGVFFDSNILLYAFGSDQRKAEIASQLLSLGGVITVQVLDEFASVSLRKRRAPIESVREELALVRDHCAVETTDISTHELALDLVQRYGFSFYDAAIVAGALQAGSLVLYSEDMQDGMRVGSLTIKNPFAQPAA